MFKDKKDFLLNDFMKKMVEIKKIVFLFVVVIWMG